MDKREQELNQALEVMHFGFRAMTFRPDQELRRLGLSRVHHRLLYFIGRNPGCSVSRLLEILKVSKQYINRPLRTLLERELVKQRPDPDDRRVKRLELSESGLTLEQELSGDQRERFEKIFAEAGPEAEKHWYRVMRLLAEDLLD